MNIPTLQEMATERNALLVRIAELEAENKALREGRTKAVEDALLSVVEYQERLRAENAELKTALGSMIAKSENLIKSLNEVKT